MNIEIKKSKKPIKYEKAIQIMEERLIGVHEKKAKELIWILEHNDTYTSGTNFNENEILDKKIKIIIMIIVTVTKVITIIIVR